MKIELLPGSVVNFWQVLGNTPRTLTTPPQRAASASPGESRAIQRESICAHPQIAHNHGKSLSGSEVAHRAATERNLRINACNGLRCGTTTPPIATAKGQTRHPGARCLGDPVKAKKHARNSSLSNRAREHSCQPQGMRRTPPVSAQVCTARARTASSQARSSNAQHRTDFKSKRAQE